MDKTTKQIKSDMTKQQDIWDHVTYLYTRYPIVARRAWPTGRVRRASKGILHTSHLLLVYVYILLISLIFSMHIDVTNKYMATLDTIESMYSSLIRGSPFIEEISLPYLRLYTRYPIVARALGLTAECAREQRYLAYNTSDSL